MDSDETPEHGDGGGELDFGDLRFIAWIYDTKSGGAFDLNLISASFGVYAFGRPAGSGSGFCFSLFSWRSSIVVINDSSFSASLR